MLISNFNLCKSEWLELVFAKRNKEYGAYYIRQHYADNVVKAMAFTFLGIITITAVVGIAIRTKPITERMINVDNNTVYVIPPAPKSEPPKPKPASVKAAAPKLAAPVNTTKFIPMVVTSAPVTEEPPKLEALQGPVGPVEIKNAGTGVSGGPIDGKDPGPGASTGTGTSDETVYKSVEIFPEPVGGAAAWSKFLQNNLRYPGEALEKQISGRVYVSFIVEKDGHLSNITVDRGAGYGMDEEAARVLKMSKAWKPGMQNGKPVRVKFTLPVNFTVDN